MAATVKTTCPYCGVGCGVIAEVAPDGAVAVRGDPDHPANFGRLCSKGAALAETLSLDDRLLVPEIDGRPAGWDEALDRVAARFSAAIAEHGPDSVALYVSGQLLTEDYYVANKLMKGFVGSANIDTNSRLCMSSSVAGHKRAFGSDTVPGTYADLEEADLVVLVGSNLAWCHPVLFQRLMAAREARGTRLVVIDPRRTPTAEAADLHLPVAADGDTALFNGLLARLARNARDAAFIEAHTAGLAEALDAAGAPDLDATARLTGLDAAAVAAFYDLFAATERVVTVYSQGVNQSVGGTDKVNAIVNCHLATGRIGRPGMGPFSVTGQPNAMGGREVGGLANQLAAHLDIENAGHRALVGAFWGATRMAARPGLKAVDLFEAVGEGRIKALWIMGTNPADSLPEADRVQEALKRCPFVVASEVIRHTDTTRFAHVLLPAAAWGEKDGTVTNSERRISRQRAFLPLPGLARPDWWIVAEVAARMGFPAFAYDGPAAIFREHARLSGLGNAGTRDFDIGGLSHLDRDAYDALKPVQWPVPAGGAPAGGRFFGAGGFFTPDRRARLVPVRMPAPTPADPDFPLVLNTGRIRDQWHTMTRTGKSVRLASHLPEPFATLHPEDAAALGVEAGALATVESRHGRVVARAALDAGQPRGTVFVPMHWTDRFASAGRVDALVPARTDPVSGQPGSKKTPARVAPFAARWHGFAALRARPEAVPSSYWAMARADGGWTLELAGLEVPDDWHAFGRRVLGADDGARLVTYDDAAGGRHRMAAFRDGRLLGAFFAAPGPLSVSRGIVAAALGAEGGEAGGLRLLAGRPAAGARPDRGETVCACFGVGLNDIVAAVTGGGCLSVQAVGAALRAGTNCGSCRPEIARIVRERGVAASA